MGREFAKKDYWGSAPPLGSGERSMVIFSTSRRATCTCRWEDLKESEVDKIARIVPFRESLSKTYSFPPPHIFDLRRVNFQEVCVGGYHPKRDRSSQQRCGARRVGGGRVLLLSPAWKWCQTGGHHASPRWGGAGGQSEGPGATGVVRTDRGCGEGPGRQPRR